MAPHEFCMNADNPPINVTAAICIVNGKILVARRAHGQSQEHKWEFPGGKVEEGETPEDCLARELLEEFSIQVEVGDHVCDSVYDYPDKRIRLMAYRVTILNGEFVLTVHDAIRWVDVDQLLEMDLAPADVAVANQLGNLTLAAFKVKL